MAELSLRTRSLLFEGNTETAQSAAAMFGFPVYALPGATAYAVWQELAQTGVDWPVVLGNDDALARTLEAFETDEQAVAQDILQRANTHRWPNDRAEAVREEADKHLADLKARSPQEILYWERSENGFISQVFNGGKPLAGARAFTVGEHLDALAKEPEYPALGQWPEQPASYCEPISFVDGRGLPLRTVYVALTPAQTPAEAAAYVRFGGFNDCPESHEHVAAIRSWEQRYGARTIVLAGDVAEFAVSRRPSSRDEALSLAREHYLYCTDVLGDGTLSDHAAMLMSSDVWFFWWD